MISPQQLFARFAKVSNYKSNTFKSLVQDCPSLKHTPKAAILVPFIYRDGVLNLLLTLRSENLRSEPGIVSFPGGSRDKDESEIETALRETEEEIGLERNQVAILGLMPPIWSRTGRIVSPVIGLVTDKNFTAQINESEVSKVFWLPIDRFLSNDNHSINFVNYQANSKKNNYALHFFQDVFGVEKETFTTWGLTAAIAILAAVVACEKLPEFEIQPLISDVKISIEDPYGFLTYMKNRILNRLNASKLTVSKL